MTIPFTKAHGAKNDFLLTWRTSVQATGFPSIARAICDRHTGIGADGWILVERGHEDGAIELYNSDGSVAEISGNGTRCAAAFLIEAGLGRDEVRIRTGAGVKNLSLVERHGRRFLFEMNMGRPQISAEDVCLRLNLNGGPREVTALNVGNPQCAVFVDDFDFDWRQAGREIESHAHFPNRTNVSFIRVVDVHTMDVRFFERGAGETMSSGTGSTGAVAAAMVRGLTQSPVRVLTAAGPLDIREKDGELHLRGPAEIVAAGEFYSES
jgi:diaminopimelate epimerase